MNDNAVDRTDFNQGIDSTGIVTLNDDTERLTKTENNESRSSKSSCVDTTNIITVGLERKFNLNVDNQHHLSSTFSPIETGNNTHKLTGSLRKGDVILNESWSQHSIREEINLNVDSWSQNKFESSRGNESSNLNRGTQTPNRNKVSRDKIKLKISPKMKSSPKQPNKLMKYDEKDEKVISHEIMEVKKDKIMKMIEALDENIEIESVDPDNVDKKHAARNAFETLMVKRNIRIGDITTKSPKMKNLKRMKKSQLDVNEKQGSILSWLKAERK